MEIVLEIKDMVNNYENLITEDEWCFANLRSKLMSEVSPEEAFRCIPQIMDYILESNYNNEILWELIVTLYTVVEIANTSEIDEETKQKLLRIGKRTSNDSNIYNKYKDILNNYFFE